MHRSKVSEKSLCRRRRRCVTAPCWAFSTEVGLTTIARFPRDTTIHDLIIRYGGINLFLCLRATGHDLSSSDAGLGCFLLYHRSQYRHLEDESRRQSCPAHGLWSVEAQPSRESNLFYCVVLNGRDMLEPSSPMVTGLTGKAVKKGTVLGCHRCPAAGWILRPCLGCRPLDSRLSPSRFSLRLRANGCDAVTESRDPVLRISV